jgi:hypothetical protein
MSSQNQRRLDRLENLMGPVESPDSSDAHEKIRRALDRVALLCARQRVTADDLHLESDEDREAWAIFDAGRKQAKRKRGEGARADA